MIPAVRHFYVGIPSRVSYHLSFLVLHYGFPFFCVFCFLLKSSFVLFLICHVLFLEFLGLALNVEEFKLFQCRIVGEPSVNIDVPLSAVREEVIWLAQSPFKLLKAGVYWG
jgi:hypothetical protein